MKPKRNSKETNSTRCGTYSQKFTLLRWIIKGLAVHHQNDHIGFSLLAGGDGEVHRQSGLEAWHTSQRMGGNQGLARLQSPHLYELSHYPPTFPHQDVAISSYLTLANHVTCLQVETVLAN